MAKVADAIVSLLQMEVVAFWEQMELLAKGSLHSFENIHLYYALSGTEE